MIEINLLPGKKKKAAGGAGLKLSLPDFRAIISQIKDPWLIGVVGDWVVDGRRDMVIVGPGTVRLRAAESPLRCVHTSKPLVSMVLVQLRLHVLPREKLV